MYKLIAIDMDGTLLNSSGKISNENRQAIKKAVEKGVKVVLASGRGFTGLEKFIEELGLNLEGQYALACNGGAAYECHTKKTINTVGIKGSDLLKIYKLSKELELKIQAYTLDACLAMEENEFTKFEKEHVGTEIKILDFHKDIKEDDDIIKVLLLEKEETLDEKIKLIPKEYMDEYTMVKSLPMAFEIMNKECHKGIGIKKLIEKLEINKEEIICIGDALNDYEMIEFAGLGIAMGNASPKIKEIANYVTLTNDENGVAHAIEKFVLN